MAESLEAEIRQLYEDWIANPSPVVCARLADRLRVAGRNDEALEVSRRGQKDWPGNNSIRMVIARCLRSSGDMPEARSAFEEVLKTDPFNLVALKNLAEMSMAEGRYRDAVKLFGDYVFENPGDPEAQQQLEEAKRKERTSPEPTPVPPLEEAATPSDASLESPSLPAAAEPLPEEPAVTVEQAFAAFPEAPSVRPVTVSDPAPETPPTPGKTEPAAGEAFAAERASGSDSVVSAPETAPEPVPSPGAAEHDAAGPAEISLQSMFGEPGQDSGPVEAPAEAPAPASGSADAPAQEPASETAPVTGDERAPAAAPAVGQVHAPDQESASSGEEAPPAPFPQTGRMERILRNQGMAVPEARPAAPAPAAAGMAHSSEPRIAQGLKREPRSLFDLFSPEERAELFLEPYRQEEK